MSDPRASHPQSRKDLFGRLGQNHIDVEGNKMKRKQKKNI
jgi:hypothetical protein